MKHYCAKPSAQLPKHIKSLQDDTKHAVMKPWRDKHELEQPQECALHIKLRNACACTPRVTLTRFICQLDKSRDVMTLAS